jgi:hypothetical protein
MAKPRPPRTVQCYHCRHRFVVGGLAMTINCPGCSKPLTVDDLVVKALSAVQAIQTCGRIVIQKKGHVIARLVEAHGGIDVEGILEANVLSGGPVRIGPKAIWKGNCTAPSVHIEPGCTIAGGYFKFPDDSLGLSDLGAEDAAQDADG